MRSKSGLSMPWAINVTTGWKLAGIADGAVCNSVMKREDEIED